MSLVLALGRVYVPVSIRQNQLRKLFACTAAALRRPAPPMPASHAALLRAYALFTRDSAEESLRLGEDEDEIRDRLYCYAYQLGYELRRVLRVAAPKDLRNAIPLVYRALGIDAKLAADGMLRIGACYFSSYYPGRVCRVMSGLDAGVLAGLSGGGRLAFSQRITEGHECCLARLEPADVLAGKS